MKGRRAGAEHRAGSDGDARSHHGVHGDPGLIANDNRRRRVAKVSAINGVTGGAEIAALGNDGVRANKDGREAVEFRPAADPGVVANRQLPWIGDAGAWHDADARANARSKQPQHQAAPAMQWLRRPGKQAALNDAPHRHHQETAPPEARRDAKTAKILKNLGLFRKRPAVGM